MLAWLFYEDGNLGSLIVLSAHLRLQLRDMYEFDVRIYQRAIYTTSGITLNNDHQPTTQMYFPCPGAATKPLNLPDLLNIGSCLLASIGLVTPSLRGRHHPRLSGYYLTLD